MGSWCCTARESEPPRDLSECVVYNPTGGYVMDVYDGDTFTIAVWHAGIRQWTRYSVRIKGIDCPEMRTKNANERTVALQAKALVESLILKKRVILQNAAREKFGRVLADVFIEGTSVGHELLRRRLAVEYHGDAKCPPEDWLAYATNASLKMKRSE